MSNTSYFLSTTIIKHVSTNTVTSRIRLTVTVAVTVEKR